MCLRISRSSVLATDTAVDLLTDFMFDHVENVRDPGGIRAYLRLMAVRRSLRKKERSLLQVPIDDRISGHSAANGVEAAAEFLHLLPRLEECLGMLTPKAQSAIRLKYTRQIPDREIGNLIGGSKQYIGRLLGRSLELLRECINGNKVTS